MIELKSQRILIVLALLTVALASFADHLPAKLLALGKPETTLAGINLESTSPDEVLRRLGPPTKTVTVPNNPYWAGYLWQTANLRIEVEVTHSKTKKYVGAVTIVRMSGESPTSVWKIPDAATGRGLKLGDSLDSVKSIYGSKLRVSKQEPVPADAAPFSSIPGVEMVTLQWKSMEFTLTAGLDAEGKIIALRLQPPECYPGGCK
jgi:hypothetical protein